MDFSQVLSRSEVVRPGYRRSLGGPSLDRLIQGMDVSPGSIPELAIRIYELVEGSRYPDVKDTEFVDFMPGLRLLHFSEVPFAVDRVRNFYGAEGLVPVISGFSGDVICGQQDGRVVALDPLEMDACVVSESASVFFRRWLRCMIAECTQVRMECSCVWMKMLRAR